jgi:hypothetical protein
MRLSLLLVPLLFGFTSADFQVVAKHGKSVRATTDGLSVLS